MSAAAALPPFAAVIVAAGKGDRSGLGVPKQFAPYRGKPVLRHSVDAFRRAGAAQIVIAIPAGSQHDAEAAVGDVSSIVFVQGGETRQASVARALAAIDTAADAVLIHDAARPIIPGVVIERLLAALQRHDGAVPVLPVVDSLAIAEGDRMTGIAPREAMRRVQTPQAFRRSAIVDAHASWQGEANAGDDAQVLLAGGGNGRSG